LGERTGTSGNLAPPTSARRRGRSNGNEAGNNTQRRRRKQKLIDRDGDGVKAPCWECEAFVTVATVFVDRIIPGVDGGTYDLNNCRVHCRSCSGRQGQRMTLAQVARLKAFRDEQTRGRGVRFKTETLRVAVESAITQSEIEHNRSNNLLRKKRDDTAAAWAAAYNPKWELALPRIRAAIRAGRPITIAELATRNDHYHENVAVFSYSSSRIDEPHVIPHDLMVLRNALRLVLDEEVTTTSLRALGVSAAMLRTVCDLAREDVAAQQREAKAEITKAKPVKAAKPRTTRKRTSDQVD
jgi:hypothetical protein